MIVHIMYMRIYNQSSYLSQISQILFVEKKFSGGEILGIFWEILENLGEIWGNFGRFCHNVMWRKIEPKKYSFREKNDKYEVCI